MKTLNQIFPEITFDALGAVISACAKDHEVHSDEVSIFEVKPNEQYRPGGQFEAAATHTVHLIYNRAGHGALYGVNTVINTFSLWMD